MPRTPAQLQAARDERRAAVLQAALAVFARTGYEGASIRLIAQEAGVAQGLLYTYFESKEALLRAIIDQGMQDVLLSFGEPQTGQLPQERLAHHIRRSFELVQQHRDYWRLSYSVRMQPDVLTKLGDTFHMLRDTIIGRIVEEVQAIGLPNAEIEAALLFAQIDGIAQHYVMDPETYPLNQIVDALVARYVR